MWLVHSEYVSLFINIYTHSFDHMKVMGAAATYADVYEDDVALKVAAVTKLTRNLFLAGLVAVCDISIFVI